MRLALDLVAKIAIAMQVGAQRHLVEREQRAARDREILAAGFAAPARRTVRAAAGIDRRAAAVRADRRSPLLSAQRSRTKTRSASSSLMRATDASESVRAAEEGGSAAASVICGIDLLNIDAICPHCR